MAEAINGAGKNAGDLQGSRTYTRPDLHLERNRQATVTWSIKACPAK